MKRLAFLSLTIATLIAPIQVQAQQYDRTHSAKTPAVAIERGSARSRGDSAGLLLAGLPIPREEIGDFACGVIWKAGQHVSKPGLRIDVVHLASFDKCIDGGGTMAASV
jgi:hypothetical protein